MAPRVLQVSPGQRWRAIALPIHVQRSNPVPWVRDLGCWSPPGVCACLPCGHSPLPPRLQRLKSVDFYRKLPTDLTEATLSGATISIATTFLILFLLGAVRRRRPRRHRRRRRALQSCLSN